MSSMDDLFGPPSPVQQLADDQVAEDRDMLRDLVKKRNELGLTQAQVGERLGVSGAAVQQFERVGGDPRLSTIRRYALALGVVVRHKVSVPETHPEGRSDSTLVEASRRAVGRSMTNAEWRKQVSDMARSGALGGDRLVNSNP